MSKKKKKGLTPEECLRRWDAAVSKIRLRVSMSKSKAVRALYESLTLEIGVLVAQESIDRWLRLLDLLEREFGPLWPQSPNVN